MKTKIALTAFLMILPSLSLAYDKAGNGGSGVVCRAGNGDIQSAELLDFYEGRILRGLKADLGTAPDLDSKVKVELARLAAINPTRAARYQTWYAQFSSDSLFLSGTGLVVIPDSDQIITAPRGCDFEQIVNQQDPQFPQDKRYTINKDIWDKLPTNDQAGLILHELIYREAITGGATDSIATRYFNSMLAANEAQAMSLNDETALYKKLFFSDLDIIGKDFTADVNLSNLSDKGDYWDDSWADRPIHVTINGSSMALTFGDNLGITWYKSGNLRTFVTGRSFPIPGRQNLTCLASGPDADDIIGFYNSGELAYCRTSAGSYSGTKYDLQGMEGAYLQFDRKGALMGGSVGQPDPDGDYLVKDYALTGKVLFQGTWQQASVGGLYSSGELQNVLFGQPISFLIQGKRTQFRTSDSRVLLYEGEALAAGTLAQATEFQVGGKSVKFTSQKPSRKYTNLCLYAEFQISQDGSISAGLIDRDTQLPDTDGNVGSYQEGEYLWFNSKGQVIQHFLAWSGIAWPTPPTYYWANCKNKNNSY